MDPLSRHLRQQQLLSQQHQQCARAALGLSQDRKKLLQVAQTQVAHVSDFLRKTHAGLRLSRDQRELPV